MNTTLRKPERMKLFFERLKQAPRPTSRQDAINLIKRTLDEIEDQHSGLPRSNYDGRMHFWPISTDFGWMNIQSDPCYWDDSVVKRHRTYIFNNGRIVIFSIVDGIEGMPVLELS
ncbi:hypothetical protein HDE76_003782 [Rhodanobacter sp. ANJX3]|uniref:hypothetical protein n=1 Tax=Rhodanobacter sp. ANJX3 TaxID=2723083 RepID=UPI00161BD269|nr:hypothetical protein [Rhodanobacter sp. ANJX3]MBB5360538.1 hypothetical protein [Rhodanobacter sp. ANJX3]